MKGRVHYIANRVTARVMGAISPFIEDDITIGHYGDAEDACKKILLDELDKIDRFGIQINEDKRSFEPEFRIMNVGDHV